MCGVRPVSNLTTLVQTRASFKVDLPAKCVLNITIEEAIHLQHSFIGTFSVHRVEKLVEAIAELRQPSLTCGDGRGTSAPPNGVLAEESYLSSNLSLLELQDDPDTLLK